MKNQKIITKSYRIISGVHHCSIVRDRTEHEAKIVIREGKLSWKRFDSIRKDLYYDGFIPRLILDIIVDEFIKCFLTGMLLTEERTEIKIISEKGENFELSSPIL